MEEERRRKSKILAIIVFVGKRDGRKEEELSVRPGPGIAYGDGAVRS